MAESHVVTPDDAAATHFPPPGSPATVASSPATVATTKGGSPTKRAAAPAIDVLDDDVLDNCLGFLDAEDELLLAIAVKGLLVVGLVDAASVGATVVRVRQTQRLARGSVRLSWYRLVEVTLRMRWTSPWR